MTTLDNDMQDLSAEPQEKDPWTELFNKYNPKELSKKDYKNLGKKFRINYPTTERPENYARVLIRICRNNGYSPKEVDEGFKDYFLSKIKGKPGEKISGKAKQLEKKLLDLYKIIDIQGFDAEETIQTSEGEILYKTQFSEEKNLHIQMYHENEKLFEIKIDTIQKPETKGEPWTNFKAAMAAATYPISLAGATLYVFGRWVDAVGAFPYAQKECDLKLKKANNLMWDMCEHPMHVIDYHLKNAISGSGIHINKTIQIVEDKSYSVAEWLTLQAAKFDKNQKKAKLKQAALKNLEQAIKNDAKEVGDFLEAFE